MPVRRSLFAVCLVAVLSASAFTPLPARAAGEDEALKQAAQAIKAGKAEPAIKLLTSILASKSVTPAQLAKGYYLRGLAYQKTGKPAQAVADVSQALWLKQLSAADAADAAKVRASAFGSAGVASAKVPDAAGPSKVAAPAEAAAAVEPAAASGSAWATESASEPGAAEPVVPVDPAPKAIKKKKSAEAEPGQGWQVANIASEQPVVAAPIEQSSSGGGIGGFFSSLFSSGEAEQPVASMAPVEQPLGKTTVKAEALPWVEKPAMKAASVAKPAAAGNDSWQVASIAEPAVVPAPVEPKSSGGIVGLFSSMFGGSSEPPAKVEVKETASIASASSWSSDVNGAKGVVSEDSPYAAPASGFSTTVESAAGSGSFLLQVGSAASPAEAQQVAAKVSAADPELAASYPRRVVEADLGAQGHFYQVQMGPFPDEKSSLKACNKLQRAGVQCFLVVQ